ncbi:MAG: alpha/beta fold hydrolase [Rubrivivax sp.]|nr:alpha/beta fold hydrolase [Rubrivivax sp.]
MLARLQQCLCLLWLVLLSTWLWWGGTAADWPLFAAGLAVLCGGHAAVLALEFCWMHQVNRTDAAPRASWRQVCRAWWAESRHAPQVFCWQQPFNSQRFQDRTSAPGRRGVLLVHGFVCNRGLWNPWLQSLQAAGHPVIAVNLEPVFGSINDYASCIDRAVQTLIQGTGLAPVVVAHSMGGLAVRCWWALPGNAHRIRHLITLGTPHQGTRLARWALPRNAREMRERSAWLQALHRAEPVEHARRMTCYYSHCDNIVFPASNATWPDADNRHLEGVAHVAMVWRPEPQQELLRHLGDGSVSPAGSARRA